MNHDKQPTPQHLENNDLTPERKRGPIILLVILVLVGIVSMAMLCYKLEHPDRALSPRMNLSLLTNPTRRGFASGFPVTLSFVEKNLCWV
jgi:hypothetical protein